MQNPLEYKPSVFPLQVYDVVSRIPFGKVTTYGLIAGYLSIKGAARVVGVILSKSNASQVNIPAHRVVNRNGVLTGKHHFETPTRMQELLEIEGHLIIDDQIQNLKDVLWIPSSL